MANANVAVGMTVLEPAHRQAAAALPVSRQFLVAAGEAITDIAAETTTLGHLDGCTCRLGRWLHCATTARSHSACFGSTPRPADLVNARLRDDENQNLVHQQC